MEDEVIEIIEGGNSYFVIVHWKDLDIASVLVTHYKYKTQFHYPEILHSSEKRRRLCKDLERLVQGLVDGSIEYENSTLLERYKNNKPLSRNEQRTFLIINKLRQEGVVREAWDLWGGEIRGRVLDNIIGVISEE